VAAGAVPAAGSAAWIPIRDRLPNTDLALALVLILAGIGWRAGVRATAIGSLSAGLSFDLLATRPYGTLAISQGTDVLTALILVATGILVGLGASRLSRYHSSESSRADTLAIFMEASDLVATGQERKLVAAALATELQRELSLMDCLFVPEPPRGLHPTVARDGSLVGLVTSDPKRDRRIDLPIWSQGEVSGHYQLILGTRRPSREDLRMAISLADQAGAAMSAPRPDPPPPVLRALPG
jgi:K+-sensing histidine kinase KdpD